MAQLQRDAKGRPYAVENGRRVYQTPFQHLNGGRSIVSENNGKMRLTDNGIAMTDDGNIPIDVARTRALRQSGFQLPGQIVEAGAGFETVNKNKVKAPAAPKPAAPPKAALPSIPVSKGPTADNTTEQYASVIPVRTKSSGGDGRANALRNSSNTTDQTAIATPKKSSYTKTVERRNEVLSDPNHPSHSWYRDKIQSTTESRRAASGKPVGYTPTPTTPTPSPEPTVTTQTPQQKAAEVKRKAIERAKKNKGQATLSETPPAIGEDQDVDLNVQQEEPSTPSPAPSRQIQDTGALIESDFGVDGPSASSPNTPKGSVKTAQQSAITPTPTETPAPAPSPEPTSDTKRVSPTGIPQTGMNLGGIKNFLQGTGLELADGEAVFGKNGAPAAGGSKADSSDMKVMGYSDEDVDRYQKDGQLEGVIDAKGYTASVPDTTGRTDSPQEGASGAPDMAELQRDLDFHDEGFGDDERFSNFSSKGPKDSALTAQMYADSARNKARAAFLDTKGGPKQVLDARNAAVGVGNMDEAGGFIKKGDKYYTSKSGMSGSEFAYKMTGGQKGYDSMADDLVEVGDNGPIMDGGQVEVITDDGPQVGAPNPQAVDVSKQAGQSAKRFANKAKGEVIDWMKKRN